MCDRISVIHKTADQLKPYYEEADMSCYCLRANQYTKLALPIKVFESFSYGTPVITCHSFAAESIILEENAGWAVDCSREAFIELLEHLRSHPQEVEQKIRNTVEAAKNHTWTARAQQVAEDMKNLDKRGI